MCGRYAITTGIQDIVAAGDARIPEWGSRWRPKASVNPASTAPVLLETLTDAGEIDRRLELGRWRFVPEHNRDARPQPLINARLDKLQAWSGWRASYADHRLVVPMSGYYEFVATEVDGNTVKQPYFIHDPNAQVIWAAGLYSRRPDGKTGYEGLGYTIITTQGVDQAGDVHDRMPVFLPPDAVGQWLQPGHWDAAMRKEWQTHLADISGPISKNLRTYPTSRALNNTRTVNVHDLSLVEPVDLD